MALPSKDGYTQICHFLPRSWKGGKTLFDIIMKEIAKDLAGGL